MDARLASPNRGAGHALKHASKGDEVNMDNDKRLHFVEASRKAVDILLHNNETARLYQLAVKRFGEGNCS